MCGLGISGRNDSVLGDSVQSGVVTEEKIDGATGGSMLTCSGHVLVCADRAMAGAGAESGADAEAG